MGGAVHFGGISGDERKHTKPGNQPKGKEGAEAPGHILNPLGRRHWSGPSSYTTEKIRRKQEVGWGGKRKQRKWRRKQLPSQLSQGPLHTLNGATGETEVGSRPEGGSCTQTWLHTQIPLASWPAIRPTEVGGRLPLAVLSGWQKQSTVPEPGQAPFPPTRQMIPWAWEIHLARIPRRGGREHSFSGPRGK